MKYYNKTRTTEQKVTDRAFLNHLEDQTRLLKQILAVLEKQQRQ